MLFTRFRQLGRTVGHVQRFRTIIHVFLKYGYEDLARQLPLPRLWLLLRTPGLRRQQAALAHLSRPERLRRAFEELGPTFVKLGQLLAGRVRLLPRAYLDELAQLNDRVPPFPFAEVRRVIGEELHQDVSAGFSHLDETPLGSASIAQVHGARLVDGREVVVKVQRPGIEHIVRADLEIIQRLAELLERHVDGWQQFRPTAIVAEFARRMEQELDFTAEIAAIERFNRQFADDPTGRAPQVHRALSSRRLLTMERIRGVPANQLAALDAAGLDRAEIARRLADSMLRQIFVHGFFHGDPHPGNVHVLPGNVLCFLDFGLTGFLVHDTRRALAALLVSVSRRDERDATRALLQLAGAELDPPRPGLEADVAEFIHRHFTGTVREFVFLRLLQHLFQLTARHELTLPPEVFTVVKALGQVEQLIRDLAPDIELLERARPFVYELHVRRMHPRRMLREFLLFGGEAAEALRALPLDFRRVAAQVRDGRARINFHHEGLQPLNDTLDRVTNRLAFAVVLAAILVASAVVIHAQVSPTWHGISIIGLVGYTFAGLMGVALMFSILRHGRM